MNADRLRLAFAGLHPDQSRDLLSRYGATGALRLLEGGKVGSERARRAAEVAADVRLRELALLGVSFVTCGSEGYPDHLAELPDAPDGLFVRGSLPESPGVAVVGTRRCTRYGRELARRYGEAIAAAGWPVVSGLARGIDAAAHRGCVDATGIGVGVLGCGIDVAYPPEHRKLAGSLVAGSGALATEYPPGTPPEGWRFPPRNRVISGLSAAVVVVEAAERGGALITASRALDQGVPVFAVPGDVGRGSSRGCNLLIRDGAHPVLEPDDLVAELELVMGPARSDVPARVELPPELDGVGPDGVDIGDLAARLAEPIGTVLAMVIRWELDGLVRVEGDLVMPA